MNEKLLAVLNALLDEINFNVNVEIYKSNSVIYIKIPIGSKTGSGDLYYDEKDDSVYLNTRYGQKDLIPMDNPVDSIAWVAWLWALDYQTRGYGFSDDWINKWESMGLLTKNTKTVTEYIVN